MKSKLLRTALLTVLILSTAVNFTGCATSSYGKPFDPDQVSMIEEGITTEAQLLEMFGNPTSATIDTEGRKTLMWFHSKVKATSYVVATKAKQEGEMLMVVLGHDGTVEHATINETGGTVNVNLF